MSASGAFGPAPPGIDLSQNQNGQIFGAVITLMVIGTIAVIMRFIARRTPNSMSLAVDDYLIVAALIFAYGTGICSLLSVNYGGGKHLWVLTAENFISIWKLLYAYVMIYATAVTCTKVSILMFYRRIFGIKSSLYVCLFLAIGYWITIIVTINVGCRPLDYFWRRYTDLTAVGTCIDIPKFFFGNGIAAMLIDVIILCVPVPIVWSLQMPTSQKLAVVSILLLGSFVCVASIVRIVTLERNVKSSDPTWTISPVFVWSCVEPFIGIVCACLPTFAPFFRRWWAVVRTKGSSGPGKNAYPSGSGPSGQGSKQLSGAEGGGGGFRLSRARGKGKGGEWTELESRLRDDEVGLTNDIVGGGGPGSFRTKGSDEEMGTIRVKEDVKWSEAHLDDGK